MSMPNQASRDPLVYQTQKKTETEEQKEKRYQRVIEHLRNNIENVRRQHQLYFMQLQRELSTKTELEYYLKKAVKKVFRDKKKQM